MTLFRFVTFGVPGKYVAIQAVLSLCSSAALVSVVEVTAPALAAIAVHAPWFGSVCPALTRRVM